MNIIGHLDKQCAEFKSGADSIIEWIMVFVPGLLLKKKCPFIMTLANHDQGEKRHEKKDL